MYNILYIGGFNLPNGNAAAQRVVANAKLLKSLSYEVFLVGLSTDPDNIGKMFEYDGIKCLNIRYPQSLFDWLSYLTTFKQYKRYLIAFSPELVVAYNHPAVALEKLTMYCKKKGIKVVSDCTEWYEPHGNWLYRKIKGWDTNRRMYKAHCHVDGVIAISKYLYDFYRERNLNTIQLPPLVDKQEKKWMQELVDDSDKIKLVFAGSIGREHKDRLDIIIEALIEIDKERPDSFILNIVGIDANQFVLLFEEWANKQLPPFIRFYGRVDHEKVISLLLESDFQIFVRDNNLANTAGFPTKFAETISARALVLTNESSNISDYLIKGENGFLLDITNREVFLNSLRKPLSLSKESLREKRALMDSTIFDYRNYTEQMKHFIESL